jgi:hypothetical protein
MKRLPSNHIGFLLALVIPALFLCLTACKKPGPPEPAKAAPASTEQNSPNPKPVAAAESKASTVAATSDSTTNVLVFRNIRSWRRKIDFEEVLTDFGVKFEVKPSDEMESTDLSRYSFVIIPGAQRRNNYYQDYANNASRFDRYVTNGGTLVLELNGAEDDGIILPRGVSMVRHGAIDNAVALPGHPILVPLGGKSIHANYASHGYLDGVPNDAIVLVTEMADDQPVVDRPTFIEYAHGSGRVIAACQCFHDQDGSGRGPLMETLISYAVDKRWFSPRK